LPDALYIHKSAFESQPGEVHAILDYLNHEYKADKIEYNVIKLGLKDYKISLLHYPTFFENSYPALDTSTTIDLIRKTKRKTSYQKSKNPPILHRKETFSQPDHPSVPLFKEITKEIERAGLYENTKTIGFKNNWERLIHNKGYYLAEGRLKKLKKKQAKKSEDKQPIEVKRHLTAIDRYSLSVPMQNLARHGFLDGDYSILDYGCGKGDDLKELQAHELNDTGWDPVYLPDGEKQKSDVVNLGFVLNVIEDPEERKSCLKEAADLSQKLLVASVMLENQNTSEVFTPYKDGVLTKRNTFQKYYAQSEFKTYIESVLGKQPVAVGPGVFYIFKDELEEQKYLSNRYRRTTDWVIKTQKQKVIKARKVRLTKFERHQDVVENYWETILDMGRMPATSEYEHYLIISSVFGSQKKGFEEAINMFGKDGFAEARKNRIGDLKVYFALSMFEQRKPYKNMPASLQKDIKAFFGKYTDGVDQSKDLLFSVGKPEVIKKACEDYHEREKVGHIFDYGDRYFRHTTQHGAIEGKTQTQTIKHYNLDVIISVGYRVKSLQGTQFRIWATQRLKEYIVKGFALNDDRFKSGSSMNYFNELQERIREIRLSERFFYQKIKDIYTTSIDYSPKDEQMIEFFKIIQKKLLWAISQQTAAELVYHRVDASLPLLGMQSYDKTVDVTILKGNTSVAKNYLNEDEMKLLGLVVEQYLAFAETMAQQHTPMYMKDWIERLDSIIQLNGRNILTHAGKISHQLAKDKSSQEYEKYQKVRRKNEQESSFEELAEDIKKLKTI